MNEYFGCLSHILNFKIIIQFIIVDAILTNDASKMVMFLSV